MCRATVLVVVETFAALLLLSASLPLWTRALSRRDGSRSEPHVAVFFLLSLLLQQSLAAATSAVFTAAHRRHLMVWAVFAPKLTFEFAWLLVLGALLVIPRRSKNE
jgi:phosphatidylinositol glycan class O